jgi:hypothetical protein
LRDDRGLVSAAAFEENSCRVCRRVLAGEAVTEGTDRAHVIIGADQTVHAWMCGGDACLADIADLPGVRNDVRLQSSIECRVRICAVCDPSLRDDRRSVSAAACEEDCRRVRRRVLSGEAFTEGTDGAQVITLADQTTHTRMCGGDDYVTAIAAPVNRVPKWCCQ